MTKLATLRDHIAQAKTELGQLNRRIGMQLQRKRKASGLSSKEVAGALGISHSLLCDMEAGRRQWTDDRVTAFHAAIAARKPTKQICQDKQR